MSKSLPQRRGPLAAMFGQPVLTVRCVACQHTMDVKGDSVPKGDVPMCPKCFSPMVATEAKS